ncbi:MAG: GNAT family N-acetyltransferase [Acidaminobacteraceae bacterium]
MIENYKVILLTELLAQEICSWKYEGKYSVYNFSDWNEVVKNKWDLSIKEKREREFVGITYNDNFIAYGRIFSVDDNTFLGVGIKPELCGSGHGKNVMNLLIEEAKKRSLIENIYVELRTFNIRAEKCYKSIGFKLIDEYMKKTFNGEDKFYLMKLEKKSGN